MAEGGSSPEDKAPPAAAAAAEGQKKEEVAEKAPKEEIDVSKPVARPDKAAFESKVAALDAEVAVVNEAISGLDAKITEAKSFGGDQSDELKEARAVWKTLRDRKDQVLRERQEISARQKAAKASLDTKMAANKSLRAELKFKSPEEIEKRIAELERKQSTTTMALKDEKDLLKEIEQLKASKKLVTQLSATNDSIATDRTSTKSIGEQMAIKNGELDAVKKKMEKQKEVLDGLTSQTSERRAVLPALFKEKDALRKDKQAKVEVIRGLKNEFRAGERKFYDHQRAVYAAKKEQRESEAEGRRAEAEQRKKEAEAEELKRVPYEEEMELCKYLVTFLEKKYVAKGEEQVEAAAPAAGDFEGLVLGGKKAVDEDEEYISLSKGKKKGRGKKKGGQKVQEKLVILPEMFEIFGLLGLEAPSTLSGVPATIEALKKKEEFFSKTERGVVESIREKRKKAEQRPERSAPASSSEGGAQPAKQAKPSSKQPKTFDATKGADELFPSLPGAPKKAPAAPAAAAEPPAAPVEESKDE